MRGEQALDAQRLGDTLLSAVVLESEAAAKYEGLLPHATDMCAWEEAADARRAHACDDFVMTTEGFSATIDAPQDGFVFFSVPYDKGFTAYVDGAETTFEQANLSFMAVYVEAGEHEIVFAYRTRGGLLGMAASGAAVIMLAVYAAISRRRTKRGGAVWS